MFFTSVERPQIPSSKRCILLEAHDEVRIRDKEAADGYEVRVTTCNDIQCRCAVVPRRSHQHTVVDLAEFMGSAVNRRERVFGVVRTRLNEVEIREVIRIQLGEDIP